MDKNLGVIHKIYGTVPLPFTVTAQRHTGFVVTEFVLENGRTVSTTNWPHTDEQYMWLVDKCGSGKDSYEYCTLHEVCHSVVLPCLFGERPYVSLMAAQDKKMSLGAAKAEERLIYYLQSWNRDTHRIAGDDTTLLINEFLGWLKLCFRSNRIEDTFKLPLGHGSGKLFDVTYRKIT